MKTRLNNAPKRPFETMANPFSINGNVSRKWLIFVNCPVADSFVRCAAPPPEGWSTWCPHQSPSSPPQAPPSAPTLGMRSCLTWDELGGHHDLTLARSLNVAVALSSRCALPNCSLHRCCGGAGSRFRFGPAVVGESALVLHPPDHRRPQGTRLHVPFTDRSE